jgi:hypothetical protein
MRWCCEVCHLILRPRVACMIKVRLRDGSDGGARARGHATAWLAHGIHAVQRQRMQPAEDWLAVQTSHMRAGVIA